ncbi:MAG: 1-phosphofructokinase [Oscillospiraceae bacterium]
MIFTVTFNPSLDYVLTTDNLVAGLVNRSSDEKIFVGGKGINVSLVLKNLGVQSTALGFTAGFTGNEIERLVADFGCKTDFIRLESGLSRINVKIKSGYVTELNGQGPEISDRYFEMLLEKIDKISPEDTLILAGSVPKSLPQNAYEIIMKRLGSKNVRVIVDAEKDLLLNVLKYKPFLIKPNHYELGDIFGVQLSSDNDIADCAKNLLEKGAQNVLVSMAEKGAILFLSNGKSIKCLPPKGKMVNSVGAGDSMVAGFIAGYLKSKNFTDSLKTGIAAGSATAFSEWLCQKEDVDNLLKEIL